MAGGVKKKTNDDLVQYVTDRFMKKHDVWRGRQNVLVGIKDKVRFLLNVYEENQGNHRFLSPKNKSLYYKSMLVHQVNTNLLGEKLTADFVDYSPLGIDYDRKLVEQAQAVTRAHKAMRYKGGFDIARAEAKQDLIWGNSFVEMVLDFNPDGTAKGIGYEYAPFYEFRNYYGSIDRMRVVSYDIETYASIYGEEALNDVAEGGIIDTKEDDAKAPMEQSLKVRDGLIQVVRFYNPGRKIFAEIHGGGGKVQHFLEKEKYPLIDESGNGFDPFLETRFFQDPTSDFFGFGVHDFLPDLANLDTTITNAATADAVWDASAPIFIDSSDPDRMRSSLREWEKSRASGKNRVIFDKSSGMSQAGKVTRLAIGANTGMANEFDEMIVKRAIRATSVDINGQTDYAPTAEQQKMKKLESSKLNTRVLLLNEQREIDFARKEMYFIQNTKTDFHDQIVEVEDSYANKYQSEDGFKPMKKIRIGDILKGAKNTNFRIIPRMEGALDDQSYMEIQDMMETIALLPDGSKAKAMVIEKMLAQKNPTLGVTRADLSTPAGQTGMQQPGAELQQMPVTAGIDAALKQPMQ